MKIHQIYYPSFYYNGIMHCTETKMLKSFSQIDDLIEEMEKKYGKDTYEMAFFQIYNTQDNKLITPHNDPTQGILFLRYRFFKSVQGEEIKHLEINNKQ